MLAAIASARPALAQGSTAEAQFDYGLAEMEAGRYASGCPALADSYRSEPRPGVLFTLASCEAKGGKSASALAHYQAYLDLFDHMSTEQKGLQKGRDKISTAERDRLRRVVPELAITLPPDAPPGTSVTRDGEPVGAPSLGVALPVDPGEHVLVVRTPDGGVHEERVTVTAAERRSFVVALTGAAPARASSPATAAAGAPRREASSSPAPAPSGPSARADVRSRTWAWIATGVGAAGLVTGAVAGAIVLGHKSTIDAHCAPDDTCDPQGLQAANDARAPGLVSTAGFAIGAAGAAAAVVLFVVSAPSSAVAGPAAHTRAEARSSLVEWRPFASDVRGGGVVGVGAAW